MPDELVFSVDGAVARPATPISLAEAGFTERAHLQEWVLANPRIVGGNVLIVTSEMASWRSASGPERDRLDILALDSSGRLVVVELKRDRAPDTVEMQAIKYAAMASRFVPEVLASQHMDFLRRIGKLVTEEEAMSRLVEHTGGDLDPDLLRQPRIVLVASEFPANVTSAVVWLSEMGVDVCLVRTQAYKTEREIIITASQIYPIPSVEDFTIGPIRSSGQTARGADYPRIPWDEESLTRFHSEMVNPTIVTAMRLCSIQPGEWISIRDLEVEANRTPGQVKGDLAGLTMMVKRRYGRSNWPFEVEWAAGGNDNAYYSMKPDIAAVWVAVSTLD